MMFSRFGDAMKDVAETLRRVYQDPPTRQAPLGLVARPGSPIQLLAAPVHPGLEPLQPALGTQELQPAVMMGVATMALETTLNGEGTWASWAAGAKVAVMPVFAGGGTGRLEVPALPRRARVAGMPPQRFQVRVRAGFEGVTPPRYRSAETRLPAPASWRGLERVLELPLAITGEDLRTAPKPVQMRCSVQIVKATGENVRNLDLLGRYRIPKKGVRQLQHDAASGRLLLLLGPEAAGSGQTDLLLARRKDDRSLITCTGGES
jgi:hypothetical protein